MTAPEAIETAPDDAERTRILNRLSRLEGQIRALRSMVEAGTDCRTVLTQVLAAKAALNRAGLIIVGRSMKECLASGEVGSEEERIDEALSILLRYAELPAHD